MSSIILPQLGKFLGGSVAGPIGAAIGQGFAASLGRELDQRLFSKDKTKPYIGPRLSEVMLQTATYGRMIPIIYGSMRLAGNIIWASEITQHRQDHYQRRGKFSRKALVASQFTYSISLAIAICAGEVNEVLRVWADDCLIDPSLYNYRFYPGSETQMPDHLIEAHYGLNRTPAFRGLCYVVIENLPLSNFNNHLPNFLFEVKRQLKTAKTDQEAPLEERIKAMVIIPGSGEFVYDTQVQYKLPKNYNPKYGSFNLQKTKINQNNREAKADSLVALKQLHETCPNLQWVAPVIGWFATSLDAGKALIMPGVEYRDGSNLPDIWQVAGFTRQNAHQITKNDLSSPIYGGTSNDGSILRYLDALKAYNYKIMFYPMIFVDQLDKPWRGRITGSAAGVKKFFAQYKQFIRHYAYLVKDKVEAFIIGSELIGLTKIKDKDNNFPAVDELISLALEVRQIMGPRTKISYAADWSEYHHTDDGWYNLDKLWACEAIDFVGIDAYFPLTNGQDCNLGEEQIIEGWQSGEGYDYYFEDLAKTKKQPLAADYAWKNIAHWWESEHINPDGKKTAWKPKQKKIWFTEIGFPSVDLCSNQPNVFYSPDSSESKFPLHSRGRVDFVAQRQALSATEKYWRHSEFLEEMFFWTWDARPFPYWPDLLQVWRDGGCWSRGHWLNGKLGLTKLEVVIKDLCGYAGIEPWQIKAEELTDFVDGMLIANQDSIADIINLLKTAYFFDSHENNGQLYFVKRSNREITQLSKADLVEERWQNFIEQKDPTQLPQTVELHYINNIFDYGFDIELAHNYCNQGRHIVSLALPLSLHPQTAQNIAQSYLDELWQARACYKFTLMPSKLAVRPNDLLYLQLDQEILTMRVINNIISAGKVNKIQAVATRNYALSPTIQSEQISQNILLNSEYFDPGFSELIILKLPILPYEVPPYGLYLGIMSNEQHWRGAEVECPDGNILYFDCLASTGVIEAINEDCIELILFNGELVSRNETELAKYANIAAIGNEVIQFARAEFLGDHRYRLSSIKRQLFSSEMDQSKRFVLIEQQLQKLAVSEQQNGKLLQFKVTSIGHSFEQSQSFDFVY